MQALGRARCLHTSSHKSRELCPQIAVLSERTVSVYSSHYYRRSSSINNNSNTNDNTNNNSSDDAQDCATRYDRKQDALPVLRVREFAETDVATCAVKAVSYRLSSERGKEATRVFDFRMFDIAGSRRRP